MVKNWDFVVNFSRVVTYSNVFLCLGSLYAERPRNRSGADFHQRKHGLSDYLIIQQVIASNSEENSLWLKDYLQINEGFPHWALITNFRWFDFWHYHWALCNYYLMRFCLAQISSMRIRHKNSTETKAMEAGFHKWHTHPSSICSVYCNWLLPWLKNWMHFKTSIFILTFFPGSVELAIVWFQTSLISTAFILPILCINCNRSSARFT